MKKPYVHSNYARKEGDDYQTIDRRCVKALVDCVPMAGVLVDCCAPNGSGIVNFLKEMGFEASGVGDASSDFYADWIVTNPPYDRGVVDEILTEQIVRVQLAEVIGFAALLRNNFDFAKSRYDMFTCKQYHGQVHMMFRPWWSEEKKHQPIHNYVWHIWRIGGNREPFVRYWKEK